MIFPVFRQFWSGTNAATAASVEFVDSQQSRWVVPFRTADTGAWVQGFPVGPPTITST